METQNPVFKRIQAALNTLGKTRKEMEVALGLPTSFLSEIKSGRTKRPSSQRILAIARYLQTTPEYLLGETDDPTPASQGEVAEKAQRVARLHDALVKAGVVERGQDLSDEQLAVITDFLKANADFVKNMADDYFNKK